FHLRRGAADDCAGTGLDGAAAHAPARRAVDGPGAAHRRGDLSHRPRSQSKGAGQLSRRGAEHDGGAAVRRFRLHPRERSRRPRGLGAQPRPQRGRKGVLSRPVGRGAQELPRRQALHPAQALAGVGGDMTDHYDELEVRPPERRERELFAALPAQIAHAKARAPHFARLFADVEPEDVRDRAALARLPVTRKSQLVELQRQAAPFGGLAATPPGRLARIFLSPGPIYDPEGRGEDAWRTARALFAAGFRAGDVVQNCFAYHLTPGGAM